VGFAWAFCAVVLALGLTALGATAASAATIPIPANPLLGGGAVEKMASGPGSLEYQLSITGFEFQQGWDNKVNDRITLDFQFSSNAPDFVETMVVFTSIRFGVAPSPVTCGDLAPGGSNPLALADFDFLTAPSTVGGNFKRGTTSNDDRSGLGQKSQICMSENGDNLFSLVFDAAPEGTDFAFSIEVEQTKSNVPIEQFQNFQVMAQAYRAVPEPGTGLLVLGGLIALTRVSRQRARRC
jgi:hypothetical protein